MIVTRRRPVKRNLAPLLLPLAALIALTIALAWQPSREVIANGPLKPLWNVAATAGAQVARPLSFASQQQQIADKNRELRTRDAALESDRKAQEAKDARISALQSQVSQLQAQPKPTPMRTVPKPAPSTLGAVSAGTAPSDEIKRAAQYWAAMDAEKAAAIAQRLPDTYVNRVFAQMAPDSVGDIMNALPAKVAARLIANSGAQTPH
ncbi:MAG: hypothetical protein NVS2B17_24680 [Candidatus Velthaea sp.]